MLKHVTVFGFSVQDRRGDTTQW